MIQAAQHRPGLVLSILLLLNLHAFASDFDTIGVTPLRAVDSTLIGTGIYVTQAEASESNTNQNQFEVSPASTGQPTGLFTWISSSGTATTFPNSVGIESGHADGVASHFYHLYSGPAPGVLHVDNYQADLFYENVIVSSVATSSKVVNQSFFFIGDPPDNVVETNYDNYVARFGTIFCSAIGNGTPALPPGAAYNNIGVGVSDGQSSIGGTPDGRAKPDLCAPGIATSFSAPYVSAAATILLQAAARGDAGTNISAVSDIRTVKALLMNGAVKSTNWTHTASMPVDATHGTGAGVLNIFNSYKQMTFGQHRAIETTSVSTGAAHPPGSNPANETSIIGWDFATANSSGGQDGVAHYYLNLSPTIGNYTLTATLVWNRQLNKTSINDLDLFLYRTTDGAEIAISTSRVDNVEHIYLPQLPSGRYDLQVLKNGGARNMSNSETYALAFEAFVVPLTISKQGGAVAITWPLYPNGFTLETTPSLSPPISWTPITSGVVISNNSYTLTVNSPSGMSYYRLRR